MICGIDLGTTCSAIGYGDKLFTNLVDSSVDFSNCKQVPRTTVGDSIVASYKKDMTMGDNGKTAIKASSIILRTLVDAAMARTGEHIENIIVSVPAAFTNIQRTAVIEAGKLADLNVVSLINEPTAAALFLTKNNPGLYIVYDLGGGTFDLTIIDNRVGIPKVLCTDGRMVAGDDFDNAILNDIISQLNIKVRYRTNTNRQIMLNRIREAKINIQKSGVNQIIDCDVFGVACDYELTVSHYEEIMKSVFGETITLIKRQLSVYIPRHEKPTILFVGGSCNCPYLRSWVCNETDLNEYDGENSDVAPDYLVALGVAEYAKSYEEGGAAEMVRDVTKRICIEDYRGVGVTVIEDNTIIPYTTQFPVSNDEDCSKLEIPLYQGNNVIAKKNEYIGTMIYDYGRTVPAHMGLVSIEISISIGGVLTLVAMDPTSGKKQEITLTIRR